MLPREAAATASIRRCDSSSSSDALLAGARALRANESGSSRQWPMHATAPMQWHLEGGQRAASAPSKHAPATVSIAQQASKAPLWCNLLVTSSQGLSRLLLAVIAMSLGLLRWAGTTILGLALRIPGLLLRLVRAILRTLLNTTPGRAITSAVTSFAKVRFHVAAPTCAQDGAGNGPGLARASASVSLFWDMIRLQSHMELALPAWLVNRLHMPAGDADAAAHSASTVPAQGGDDPTQALPASGATLVLRGSDAGAGREGQQGRDLQLVCSQDLTRTILRFLEQQQQQQPQAEAVFRMASPRKGDPDSRTSVQSAHGLHDRSAVHPQGQDLPTLPMHHLSPKSTGTHANAVSRSMGSAAHGAGGSSHGASRHGKAVGGRWHARYNGAGLSGRYSNGPVALVARSPRSSPETALPRPVTPRAAEVCASLANTLTSVTMGQPTVPALPLQSVSVEAVTIVGVHASQSVDAEGQRTLWPGQRVRSNHPSGGNDAVLAPFSRQYDASLMECSALQYARRMAAQADSPRMNTSNNQAAAGPGYLRCPPVPLQSARSTVLPGEQALLRKRNSVDSVGVTSGSGSGASGAGVRPPAMCGIQALLSSGDVFRAGAAETAAAAAVHRAARSRPTAGSSSTRSALRTQSSGGRTDDSACATQEGGLGAAAQQHAHGEPQGVKQTQADVRVVPSNVTKIQGIQGNEMACLEPNSSSGMQRDVKMAQGCGQDQDAGVTGLLPVSIGKADAGGSGAVAAAVPGLVLGANVLSEVRNGGMRDAQGATDVSVCEGPEAARDAIAMQSTKSVAAGRPVLSIGTFASLAQSGTSETGPHSQAGTHDMLEGLSSAPGSSQTGTGRAPADQADGKEPLFSQALRAHGDTLAMQPVRRVGAPASLSQSGMASPAGSSTSSRGPLLSPSPSMSSRRPAAFSQSGGRHSTASSTSGAAPVRPGSRWGLGGRTPRQSTGTLAPSPQRAASQAEEDLQVPLRALGLWGSLWGTD